VSLVSSPVTTRDPPALGVFPACCQCDGRIPPAAGIIQLHRSRQFAVDKCTWESLKPGSNSCQTRRRCGCERRAGFDVFVGANCMIRSPRLLPPGPGMVLVHGPDFRCDDEIGSGLQCARQTAQSSSANKVAKCQRKHAFHFCGPSFQFADFESESTKHDVKIQDRASDEILRNGLQRLISKIPKHYHSEAQRYRPRNPLCAGCTKQIPRR